MKQSSLKAVSRFPLIAKGSPLICPAQSSALRDRTPPDGSLDDRQGRLSARDPLIASNNLFALTVLSYVLAKACPPSKESHAHRRDKDRMNRSKVGGSEKQRALASEQRNQPIDREKAEDARGQFAMRVIWVTLGIVCAVLGTLLLAILLR